MPMDNLIKEISCPEGSRRPRSRSGRRDEEKRLQRPPPQLANPLQLKPPSCWQSKRACEGLGRLQWEQIDLREGVVWVMTKDENTNSGRCPYLSTEKGG